MEERLESAEVAALYALHADELHNFLLGVLRDPSLVQDVLQATFVKLIERGAETQEESRKGWLFKVAFNQAREFRRRGATGDRILREKVAPAAESTQSGADVGPLERCLKFETVERVKQAIAELSPEQQQVVQLRIYEELKFAEIAEQLGIPLGTVLTRMRAALEKLRRRLLDF